ncbi:MAG: 6-bladed beta-propeller [Candidatus Altiarchaeota archaeon]
MMKRAALLLCLLLLASSAAAGGGVCGTPQFHNLSVELSNYPPEHLPASRSVQDSLGDNRTFWVVDNGWPTQVTATLRAASGNAYVYVQYEDPGGYDVWNDGVYWDGYITQDDVNTIANEFNSSIYPVTRSVFGEERPTGVDNDAHVTILLYDIDSSFLYGNWLNGWVLGYFYPGNERTTAQDPYSNQRKMIYIDTYPSIERGSTTTYTPSANHNDSYYPEGANESFGTVAHEFQHMIHWYHDQDEDTWVNEGLSDYSEYANGYGHMMDHVSSFLSRPDDDLTQWGQTSADYGSSYLFILYLLEKYGGNVTAAALVNDSSNGIAGINNTLSSRGYSQNFLDAFNDWTIANYVDDTTIYSGRYGYDSINLRVQPSKVHSRIHSPMPTNNASANVSNWAADYIKFLITSENNTLNLSFWGNSHTFRAYVIRTNMSNSSQTIVENFTLNPSRFGTSTYYDFGQGYDTVVFVPTAQDSDYGTKPAYNYSTYGSNITGATVVGFGAAGTANGRFDSPEGIALDPTLEYVYVADTSNHRIQIFTIDGTHVHSFGRFGGILLNDCGCFSGWDVFDSPQGITVGPDRTVYAADTQNDRIKIYNPYYPNSDFIAFAGQIGEYGTQDGEFTLTADAAVNSAGEIIVSDSTTSSRVQIFYPNLTFKSRFGGYTTTSEEGKFDDPRAVDVDNFDKIYVADMDNGRVQVFQPNGTYDFEFGSPGNGDGQLSVPEGIAVDTFGRIYVADTGNNRIQIFNPNGSFYTSFGGAGNNTGNFSSPKAVAVDPLGRIYVADTGNNRIQIFGFSIQYIPEIYTLKSDINLSADTMTELDNVDINVTVRNVGFSDAGNFTVRVYAGNNATQNLLGEFNISILAESTHRVSTNWTARLGYDRISVNVDANNAVTEINEYNNGVNKTVTVSPIAYNLSVSGFSSPEGVAVDSSLFFYVADRDNDTVEVYYPDNGSLYQTIGNSTYLDRPSDVFVDSNSRVFIADTINNEIDVYSGGTYYDGAISSLSAPQGVAVDDYGKVYVANTGANNVKVYYSNWVPYLTIGELGSGEGQLNTLMDVASGRDGKIYVSDRFNHRIQVFHPNGSFNFSFGSNGSGEGLLDDPHQISVGLNDLIYIADRDNRRVQIFNPDGSFNFTFNDSSRMLVPEGLAVDKNGRVYVTDTSSNTVKSFDIYAITADTSAPVISNPQPANNTVLEPYTTSFSFNITTDDVALCRLSNTSGTSYTSMSDDFDSTNSLLHTENITSLSNNQTVTLYIRCGNTWGYNSTGDYILRYSVSAPDIVLNELLPGSGVQWIELYNRGHTRANISGWVLNHSGEGSYTMTSVISQAGYLLLYNSTTGIQLNGSQDSVFLYDSSGALKDNITYSGVQQGYSFGRVTDGNITWASFNSSSLTPGTSNDRTGSVQQSLYLGWNLISLPVAA